MEAINTHHLSSGFLTQMNESLGEKLTGDCVFIDSELRPPLDDEFRVVIERIKEKTQDAPKEHLIVMLHTAGGYMETVERLVAVMRTHYKLVSFIIPNYAYSAGTVLALSADRIYMDYYSVLGPIDPQIVTQDGRLFPGRGVLAKFEEICNTINEAENPQECRAELAYLVKQFDPEQLFAIEQAVQHGISLITEWLPKYKFKDWTTCSRTQRKVTPEMKEERAREIAKALADATRWHSHGRGIPMRDLRGSDLRLKIDDFGENPELSATIRNYHGLAVDYCRQVGYKAYIHFQFGNRRVL